MAQDQRETFNTEAEAIAFKEGLEAAFTLLESPCTPETDTFVDGDEWVVEYSISY